MSIQLCCKRMLVRIVQQICAEGGYNLSKGVILPCPPQHMSLLVKYPLLAKGLLVHHKQHLYQSAHHLMHLYQLAHHVLHLYQLAQHLLNLHQLVHCSAPASISTVLRLYQLAHHVRYQVVLVINTKLCWKRLSVLHESHAS